MNVTGRKAVIAALIILLAAAVQLSRIEIDREREIHFIDKSPQFLPRGETLKWLSMGYRGMMADLLWIKTVLYYGRRIMDDDNPYFVYAEKQGAISSELSEIQYRTFDTDTVAGIDETLRHNLFTGESRGLVDYVYPMLERVTTIDPHFTLPYFFGGIHVLMNTGEVDPSYHLLEKGYRFNPEEWRFPFYLGWIDWMYKGNTRSAHAYMLEAITMPGCPDYVGSLLAGLTGSLNRTEMTTMYLQGLLESTESEEIRNQIREVLQALETRR
ncbi:hypothetical protein JXO52_00570 [bacterium]|nr:hypothetical protein [bacterium]